MSLPVQIDGIAPLVAAAVYRLAEAKTSAEVLDARDMASVAYGAAKSAARMAKAKGAHDELIAKVHRAQADALDIEAAAKRRLAEEYDAAQERGEVATGREGKGLAVARDNAQIATAADLGLRRDQIHEARRLRDAEAADPGIVRRVLDEALKAGDEPTRARLQKAVKEAAKAVRAQENAERLEKRLENLAEISRGNTGLSTDVRYPVIYADPPWRYENPPMGASNRSIENHYPTMTLDEICALPVGDLATDDAILYLWATAPKLAECMAVIEAWGFDYRTCMVWDKAHIGMGYHARNQHEILLIAKRGSIPPPPVEARAPSVYREKRGAHSAKPAYYYELIERAYPSLPKIELFSRTPRKGWAVWGNQSGAAA